MWHINSGLNTNGNPYNLSKVGNKMITIRGIVDAALGSININEGIFCFQFESSSMGDPSKTVTIAAGATLGFTSVSQTMDKVCVLDGGTIWAMNGYSASQNTFAGPISVDSAGGTFDAGSGLVGGSPTPSAVLHLTGPITGPGGVTKNGPGTVFITGTPGYDGNSAINAGILQINTIGSPVLHSVTGAGTLGVGNGTNITSLTVDSINLGTLTIGAGSTVNIAAIPGGPLAEPLPLTPVPEPSALAMLLLAAMGLGIYHRRR
jgi:autotransporter-associated beta strand protein